MNFSATFLPTTLFSLKDSNSTSSGAKSLFLPSPYAIKMALLSQAISLGNEDFVDKDKFSMVRDTIICYRINGDFCVNNCFVKIQKQRGREPFKPTVSFREYIYINNPIEIIFNVSSMEAMNFWKKYLFRINYFGKKGSFFQFCGYNDSPVEANVKLFNVMDCFAGVIQEYDDFDDDATFEMVSSYSTKPTKRNKRLFVLPLMCISTSKSYSYYQVKESFQLV